MTKPNTKADDTRGADEADLDVLLGAALRVDPAALRRPANKQAARTGQNKKTRRSD